MISPYATLGISSSATEEQIKKAYRELVLQYHPDRNNGRHSDRFIDIQKAYEILKDPHKKELYDKYGDVEKIIVDSTLEGLNKELREKFGGDEELENLRDKNLKEASRKMGFRLRECSNCEGSGVFTKEIGFFIKREKCGGCSGKGFIEIPIKDDNTFHNGMPVYVYKRGGVFRW